MFSMIGPFRARRPSSRRPPASRPLAIEPLEDRRLLAATALEPLADISPAAASTTLAQLTSLGSTLFFSAAPNGTNRELWKSDGTATGTVMVKNINPNSNSDPLQLTAVNDTLFFTAADGSHGRELWKSDGTTGGTMLVKDISATGSAFPSTAAHITPFAHIGSTLFFGANDGVNGNQLWKSDGTSDGTTPVSTFTSPASATISNITPVGQSLFFVFDNGSDAKLYVTDAAGAAPALVKEINATGDDAVEFLSAIGSTLYFRADDGTAGLELWKTDGTAQGTTMVKDIRTVPSSAASAYPNQLTNVGGTLYFSAINQGANRELWKSDGTAANTVKVKEINAGFNSAAPSLLTNVGGTLFFTATDGTNNELWKSNGTDAGTVRVTSAHLPSTPSNLINVGGTLYFTGTTAAAGVELWRSDGTDAGTAMVKDLEMGATGSAPTGLTEFFGRIVLVATTAATGTEIFHEPPASYADFDLDHDTDGADFLKWQRVLGTSDATTDANKNGAVDAADLTAWKSNFGYFAGASAASAANAESAESATSLAAERAAGPSFAANVFLVSDLFASDADAPEAVPQQAVVDDGFAAHDAALIALMDRALPVVSSSSTTSGPAGDALIPAGSDDLPTDVGDSAFADLL